MVGDGLRKKEIPRLVHTSQEPAYQNTWLHYLLSILDISGARWERVVFLLQDRESRGSNDRVHGISCRYSDKACKKINYISTNTYSIFMQ